LIALPLLLLGLGQGTRANEALLILPGSPLAPFTLPDRDGKPTEWRPGRVTVITCCAFWCDTWKDQLPRVAEVARRLGNLPVDYLTVSVDGRWTERMPPFSRQRLLADPDGRWIASLGIDRVPYTLVIDQSGTVTACSYGTVRTDTLAAQVRSALTPATAAGSVYLTFDDFPEPGAEALLDLLRAQNVRATFFCIAGKAAANAALLQRAVREGHALEVHSWDHDVRNPQLERCRTALREVTGQSPTLYRPPGSERIFRLDGGALTLPIADPYDFARPGVKELIRRVALRLKPSAVIQLHAGVAETLQALPQILTTARAQALRFDILRP